MTDPHIGEIYCKSVTSADLHIESWRVALWYGGAYLTDTEADAQALLTLAETWVRQNGKTDPEALHHHILRTGRVQGIKGNPFP